MVGHHTTIFCSPSFYPVGIQHRHDNLGAMLRSRNNILDVNTKSKPTSTFFDVVSTKGAYLKCLVICAERQRLSQIMHRHMLLTDFSCGQFADDIE